MTDHIETALKTFHDAPQACLCGLPGMIDTGIQALTQNGISLGDIHHDKFTDASTTAGDQHMTLFATAKSKAVGQALP